MIDFLIAYLTDLKADSLPTQIANFLALLSAVLSSLGAVYLITYYRAQRKFRKGIVEATQLKDQVAGLQDTIREVSAESDAQRSKTEALEKAGPKGYLAQMEIEERDGNFGPQVKLSEEFLSGQQVALHMAFSTITHSAIGHAVEDGSIGYENALLYARAGLAVNRDDTMLRALVEDLLAVARANELGLAARPRDEEARAARLHARNALPQDLKALWKNLFKAREQGQYALMVAFAAHGLRLAERLSGRGSRDSLLFAGWRAEAIAKQGRHSDALAEFEELIPLMSGRFGERGLETLEIQARIAECHRHLRNSEKALRQFEELLPVTEDALGEEHYLPLVVRFNIAAIHMSFERYEESITLFEALLPIQEKVLGKNNPGHDLATRTELARCHHHLGRFEKSLKEYEDILQILSETNLKRHPTTLEVRIRTTNTLIDLGRYTEAQMMIEGVLTGLREAGFIEDDGWIVAAKYAEEKITEYLRVHQTAEELPQE